MRVAAIVVTFNRRELLQATLAGLEAQKRPIDRIFVIDNASTDGTDEMLRERKFQVPTTVETLSKNTGGAGGFSKGIEVAFAAGFDAFWLMDDDTVPQPEALGEMLDKLEKAEEATGELPSFACSLVLWKDGSLCEMNTPTPTWDWPRPYTQGGDWINAKSCSFVSCLVTREAVHACGLPYQEYFIWFDDAEYTNRLSRWRPGIFVPSSKVDHLLADNRGVNWGDLNENNAWKFTYGARNQVSAAVSLRSIGMLADLVENMLRQFRGSGVPRSLQLKMVKSALSGFFFRPRKRFPRTVR